MNLLDFDYQLPKHLIAQVAKDPRDSSRLMVVRNDHLEHRTFRDLADYLNKGDVLVINDSKVLPVRLYGKKKTGGKVEVLLINREMGNTYDCLIKGKNIKENLQIVFGNHDLEGYVKHRIEGGRYSIEFISSRNLDEMIREIGEMPIPPYIKQVPTEPERYQTIYAKENGSIAAPTAGLHFTESFLDHLKVKGVEVVSITLHVSIGTFLPVRSNDIEKHRMEPEYFRVDADSAERINHAKDNKGKVFAVGTTTLKVLESACDDSGQVLEKEGKSDLFIYPGYGFKLDLDGLLTNFHLPQSTLLMLVSAFAGRERILNAYEVAIEHSYRFYSFGDAMLILKG